jgi:hypothetical protein
MPETSPEPFRSEALRYPIGDNALFGIRLCLGNSLRIAYRRPCSRIKLGDTLAIVEFFGRRSSAAVAGVDNLEMHRSYQNDF